MGIVGRPSFLFGSRGLISPSVGIGAQAETTDKVNNINVVRWFFILTIIKVKSIFHQHFGLINQLYYLNKMSKTNNKK
jgi:hypothetical protein